MSDTSDRPPRERLLLEAVPKVSWQLHEGPDNLGIRRCPECTPWCSCLRACLEYIKTAIHNMS